MGKVKYGDCYEMAFNNVIENKNLLLCHGIAAGQGKLKGSWISHAWNELGDIVFDFSNGKARVIRKERYYAIGKITKVKKYSSSEAIKLVLESKHYGPWAKEVMVKNVP